MGTSLYARMVRWLRQTGRRSHARGKARLVRQLFGQCPCCARDMEGHGHFRIASALLGEPLAKLNELDDMVAAGRWTEAAKTVEWAHDRDVKEYHLIRCPRSACIGLVVAVFTAELWSPDRVEQKRKLRNEEADSIRGIAGDRWLAL